MRQADNPGMIDGCAFRFANVIVIIAIINVTRMRNSFANVMMTI